MENQSPLYIGNSFVYHERLYNNLNEMGLTIESDWKRFDFTFYLINIITSPKPARNTQSSFIFEATLLNTE